MQKAFNRSLSFFYDLQIFIHLVFALSLDSQQMLYECFYNGNKFLLEHNLLSLCLSLPVQKTTA